MSLMNLGDMESVAVIGMAGRFPGAPTITQFWDNLLEGRESIRAYEANELVRLGVDPALAADPHYVPAAATLDGVDLFDAAFFGMSPREAALMDPQQRIFLECAWQALEHAGYADEHDGKIGVFGGSGANRYLLHHLYHSGGLAGLGQRRGLNEEIPLGSDKDHLTTRVAYALGLTGPALTIQTACSTSLAAVAIACQNILDYRCELALAGGVSLETFGPEGYLYRQGGMLSPDGHCRAFDAMASGTVFGSGVGVVVLKRLDRAIESRDTILAVIRGFGVTNDGATRAGYVAPSIDGQAEAIAQALAMAQFEGSTIDFVETHGAGTELGDPIEIAALAKGLGPHSAADPLILGAVKTNIGHLGPAAGVAGLIKTVLALHHKVLPPSLHFQSANRMINLEDAGFRVATAPMPWRSHLDRSLRAGVSSFGLGGTNVHLVLEAAPEPVASAMPEGPHIIAVSAKTKPALAAACSALADHVEASPNDGLADIAFTAAVGRRQFPERIAVTVNDRQAAVATLRTFGAGDLQTSAARTVNVVFMFPGLGEHYVGMAAELYAEEHEFRRQVDHCCDLLSPRGRDFRGYFVNRQATAKGLNFREMIGRTARQEGQDEFDDVTASHLVTFIVEYALATVLIGWGVRPAACIGHSLGEYAAACISGVLQLRDALLLVMRRASLLDALPRGAMTAVPLSEHAARAIIRTDLDLAAVNAPDLCVVAGPECSIAELEGELADRQVICRRIRTSHAFHSRMLEPVRQALVEAVSEVPLTPPRIPVMSNVTGDWLTATQAIDPQYWGKHLCQTVHFAKGISKLMGDGSAILLEVGPGQILSSLALLQANCDRPILSTISPPYNRKSDAAYLRSTLCQLWMVGAELNWQAYYSQRRGRRIPLPTYPFERQRHWIEANNARPEDRSPPLPQSPLVETAAVRRPAEVGSHQARLHPRPASQPDFVPCQNEKERLIAETWQELFGFGPIGRTDDFFLLGGHSLMALQLANRLWQRLSVEMPLRDLVEHPTVAQLAEHISSSWAAVPPSFALKQDWPTDARNWLLRSVMPTISACGANLDQLDVQPMSSEIVARARRDFGLNLYPNEIASHFQLGRLAEYLDRELAWHRRSGAAPNVGAGAVAEPGAICARIPNVVFLLSSVRSGSTLLRVMLAGHPRIFCPPEMHLLSHATLKDRNATGSALERDQGLVRALADLLGSSPAEAGRHLARLFDADVSSHQVFAHIQRLAGDRLLIDKSPGYSTQPAALQRTEAWFDHPKYVYLTRHPYSVIDSFVKNRFHRLLEAGEIDPYLLGEFVWQSANSNIQDHLASVDPARVHRLRYEDMVADPVATMRDLCSFLDLPFDPEVLRPYDGSRMRDGLGDPNFLNHDRIVSSLGQSWQTIRLPRPLNRFARQLAGELAYELPDTGSDSAMAARVPSSIWGNAEANISFSNKPTSPIVVKLQKQGTKRPLFAIHPLDGSIFCYVPLSRHLNPSRPFFGIQSPGLAGSSFPDRVEDMAGIYADAMRGVQPSGPYLLCGWSLGGIIAFEIARQLRACGERVDFLGLFDSADPGERQFEDVRNHFDRHLGRFIEFQNGLELQHGMKARELRFEIFRSNASAAQNYVPQSIDTSILLLRAREESAMIQSSIWEGLAKREFSEVIVPGSHFTMLSAPNVQAIADLLNTRLKELS